MPLLWKIFCAEQLCKTSYPDYITKSSSIRHSNNNFKFLIWQFPKSVNRVVLHCVVLYCTDGVYLKKTSPHLVLRAQDQRLSTEQDQYGIKEIILKQISSDFLVCAVDSLGSRLQAQNLPFSCLKSVLSWTTFPRTHLHVVGMLRFTSLK